MLPRAEESPQLVGVGVGVRGPGSLSQGHAVVSQQRPLFSVQVTDRQVVVRQRAIKADFAVHDLTLGQQQDVEIIDPKSGTDPQDFNLTQVGVQAVVIRHQQGVRQSDPSHGVGQIMADPQLRLVQQGAFAVERQPGMGHGVAGGAESDRKSHFQSRLPFLIVTAGNLTDQVAEGLVVVAADQVVTQSAHTVSAEEIELRATVQLRGIEFQFTTLEVETLATDLDAALQGLRNGAFPIEHDLRVRRGRDRFDQPSVGGG